MKPVHTAYDRAEVMEFAGAITLRVLLSGDQTGGELAVFEDIVEPGVGPGRHIHEDQDETFFFLEGSFDVEIDGVLHHMQPGDVGFVPRGTVHAFRNVGEGPGRLRYVFNPALGMEAMFRELFAVSPGGAKRLDSGRQQLIKENPRRISATGAL